MDYADISLQVESLLGELAEGSGTYTPTDLANAVQWAQEQEAQALGLTYTELNTQVATATGPWGETLRQVSIPSDAIKVARCEIGTQV